MTERKMVELEDTLGATRRIVLPIPHPIAALALKLSAWKARRAEKDAFDVWRLLEVCAHDHLTANDWPRPTMRADVESVWVASFSRTSCDGTLAVAKSANLVGAEAEGRAARVVSFGLRMFSVG